MLLLKDSMGHYIYKTQAELATTLRVSKIVTVPVMDGMSRDYESSGLDKDNATGFTEENGKIHLLAIYVNPADYTWGADKGGEVNFFDDFDIDYNQQKYLMETRRSGALIKPFSAIVFETQVKDQD